MTTFFTDQHVPGTNLTGQWTVISGSYKGVGLEAAKYFASWGANIILACCEPPAWELHPTAAVDECNALTAANGHSSTIEWWQINLADLSSVEAFCQLLVSCATDPTTPTISSSQCRTSSHLHDCFHQLGAFDLDHVNGGPGQKGDDYLNNKLDFQMWVAELQSKTPQEPRLPPYHSQRRSSRLCGFRVYGSVFRPRETPQVD
ncbi:hypothetical protein PDIDSM_8452 [Penicillium digitatum]|nr:hypothetical protein PDIDSM_8452 [Penicillium digitatum]